MRSSVVRMSQIKLLPVAEASIAFVHGRLEISNAETRQSLEQAAALIKAGQTVAFPTETVYGLGADATKSAAVRQIFQIKGRPLDNPLIAHVDSLDMLHRFVDAPLSDVYAALARQFWPGPLTLLFRLAAKTTFAKEVTASQPTVAIRIPAHPVARALIRLADCPLAAPSANTSGRPSPTHFEHVVADMNRRASSDPSSAGLCILSGSVSDVGLESTVVDGVTQPGRLRILRPGGIGPDAIEACLRKAGLPHLVQVYGRDWKDAKEEATPTTPGMKYRHYSPSCKAACVEAHRAVTAQELETFVAELNLDPAQASVGYLALSPSRLPSSSAKYVRSFGTDPQEQAASLFAGLRELELQQCDLILIECPSSEAWQDGIGLAVQERLAKATGQARELWKVFQ
jgi:L-threonylcarbamoyladenylate synthase